MDTDTTYPYTGTDDKCSSTLPGLELVNSIIWVPPQNPIALQAAVAVGPVSVAVDASEWGI